MRIPKKISIDKEGQYCTECFSDKIQRIFKKNLTYYHCSSCGKTLERSLVIDNKIVWWIDKNTRECWHESVGIFVFNSENKALFFERVMYPFAFAVPAGHLDVGEDVKTAVKRELKEEAGIIAENITLFTEEDVVGDQCRRGADNHRWHLYTTKVANVKNIKINDEGVNPVWLSLEEALQKDLVYPIRYFIQKYGKKLIEK
jgi:8-oxo-dGTP pyrophosphatase MutT (NUDIX family)